MRTGLSLTKICLAISLLLMLSAFSGKTNAQITEMPIPTPTTEPYYSSTRNEIMEVMRTYGNIQEYYLSDSYWQRLETNIERYGSTKKLLVLELHGDKYSMYDGNYEMTPETFYNELDHLMSNNYHFVTIHELYGFLNGWLKLPDRSIVLTSDTIGGQSIESITRITKTFSDLEKKHGYKPHMILFIWTQAMSPEESYRCKNDVCWQSFRDAINSQFFTIGTHSQYHGNFSLMTENDTLSDLKKSITLIHDNLGINVYAIAWPFEACSPYEENITKKLGVNIGFGELRRPLNMAYTYPNDEMPMCLPRLFPPNPDGYSGRPNGLTLQEMLNQAKTERHLDQSKNQKYYPK